MVKNGGGCHVSKVKTYDILNAGPRNRFMANGKIVSNSGRTFQPQNMLRPTMKPYSTIAFGIEAILADGEDFFFEDVMKLLANAVRGCIIASPGKKLYVSDLSSIEGRVLPWLAGEQWKLDAYASGLDMYLQTVERAFNLTPGSLMKQDWRRQIGKVMELMLGFGSGVGGFITGAATYKIQLDEMADACWPTISEDIIEEATKWWEESAKRDSRGTGSTFGLEKKTFIVCDSLKRMWRRANPRIVQFWADLDEAFRSAVRTEGVTYSVGPTGLAFRRQGVWLRVILPSGRSLCYVAPRIMEEVDKDEAAEGRTATREYLSYLGQCQYTRMFRRLRTYGAKLAENITQAVSRDIMAENMTGIERAGYEILLTVHDEIISEAADDPEYSCKKLSDLLARNPIWADNLPLAAGGFEAYRYRKDD